MRVGVRDRVRVGVRVRVRVGVGVRVGVRVMVPRRARPHSVEAIPLYTLGGERCQKEARSRERYHESWSGRL